MIRTALLRSWCLIALAGLHAQAQSATAQSIALPGRVIGPAGEPIAGLEVLLHRVTDGGGALVAQGRTDAGGRFDVRADGPADANGVYFAATRYEGRLYIGPMLKPPFPTDPLYVIQVGMGSANDVQGLLESTTNPAAPTPARSPGLVFAIVILTSALFCGAFLAVNGAGPPRDRLARIRIAQLDEASASGDRTPPQDLARRRRELVRQAIDAP